MTLALPRPNRRPTSDAPSSTTRAETNIATLPLPPSHAVAVAAAVVLTRYGSHELCVEVCDEASAVQWHVRLDPESTLGDAVAQIMSSSSAIDDTAPDLRVRHHAPTEADHGEPEAPLTLTVGCDQLSLNASDGLLGPTDGAALLGHIGRVLANLAALPAATRETQLLSRISILTDVEAERLEAWNATSANYPTKRCLAEAFEEQADRVPNAVAVEDAELTLTYEELDTAANAVAAILIEHGLGPEKVVGLVADRSTAAGVAILAIFKAGAAYAPLDGWQPPARLAAAVAQSQPDVLLVNDSRRVVVEEALTHGDSDIAILSLERLLTLPPSNDRPVVVRSPTHLAYVLTTSGSTGTPKSAMIEQLGMMNHAYAMIDALALDAKTVMAQNAALSFDVSVWQIITPLLIGARVSFAPDDTLVAPSSLFDWLHARSVSVLQIVPSLMATVLTIAERSPRMSLPATMQWVIPTGEALPPDIARRWLNRFPAPPLVNAYGPAECSDDVTLHTISRPPDDDMITVPIGRPVGNVTVDIVDPAGLPLPVGVVGEIVVGGVGVGRGYRSNPLQTARSFIFDSGSAAGRRYRTGDLGRRQHDGTLLFEGRLDHQVKVNGQRIELDEIESAMTRQLGIEQALVVQGEAGLVGYLTLSEPKATDRDKIRNALARLLPDYMIPRSLVVVDAFPVNNNGKIDRAKLPAPTRSDRPSPNGANSTPQTVTEQALAKLWRQVLGVDPGRTDDFFDLGGSSLTAAVMLWEVSRRLGADLPISAPVGSPTLAALAARIDDDAAGRQRPELIDLQADGHRIPLFLAPGQGGSVLGFVPLSRILGDDQPLFGLDLQRRRDDAAELQTFTSLADCYLRAIRARYPHGPYVVGGWCMGGEVALEVARQLRAEGEDVPLVVMLQTEHRDYPRPLPGTSKSTQLRSSVADRVRFEREMRRNMTWTQQLSYFRNEIVVRAGARLTVPVEFKLAKLLQRFNRRWTGSEYYHQARWSRADGNAYAGGYRPAPYDGDVLVIRASNQPTCVIEDPTLGWGETITGRLHLADTSGYHWNFLRRPQIVAVAAQLRSALDRLDQPGSVEIGRQGGDS